VIAEGIALVRQNDARRQMAFPAQGRASDLYWNI